MSSAASVLAPPGQIPSWLPSPLQESYIQKVAKEISYREAIRVECHDPRSPESAASPTCAAAYCTSVAKTATNLRFNRYTDVVPYDRTRVVLSDGAYLNASWVREFAGGRWTVATQAPLDRTVHAFLSMFLLPVAPPQDHTQPTPSSIPASNRLRTIVQLTPNVEGNINKAFQYFPRTVGETLTWSPAKGVSSPPIKVKLVQSVSPEEEGEQPSWIHSVLALSYEGHHEPPHLVRHLHFLGWPDHGTPRDVRSLLQFMKFVDACNADTTHADAAQNPDPPIVIGCSAGVGRTGTYIALRSLFHAHGLNQPNLSPPSQSETPTANWTGAVLSPSPLGPLSPALQQDKIALEVDALREQRPMMVQSVDQLRFLYTTFIAALELEGRNRMSDS
ncbi:SubName: Full=Uncharacterized protein {ECO:0000313/EMBL:CCA69557.1} [Serendipita indica DSM 11827]|uniref:Phosphatases II n=1 Tax=Serendipita indica (strain DSM 11827) TaxID=1109443 RepID=G4TE14_SERID|nr:SubName: Full=Uncharacterized protein {ECO:0000313/EMBL:CCA69557.1} [Serendipita indica DSM 11827]CCA69557.1 hypothetical protein PIIN_03496 [Serendipita indica DSM 11827]